jgi:pimeloyl-ACP methyl ester carboxylesterase
MLTELRIDEQAPWKRRYRLPTIAWTEIAKSAPARGLAAGNQTGKYQLYAWDVPSGQLRQLTDRPEGVLSGYLSADGRHVYYLEDKGGNEIGHYVRVPFEGGEPEVITPSLPPYSSWYLGCASGGTHLGFLAANSAGFHVYCLDLDQGRINGEPRLLYRHSKLAAGPYLSHGGEIAVVASTERTQLTSQNLYAFDSATGQLIGELWDGEGSSLEPIAFSPRPGDIRLLARANRSGVFRPVIWNPRTGERIAFPLPELAGEVGPIAWSPDGERILISQFDQAVQQLYMIEVASGSLTRLDHPGGTYGFWGLRGIYFASSDEIFTQWQDSTHPSQVIALDSRTGKQLRTVLPAVEGLPNHAWKSITFTSSDGQLIQGWLGQPDGAGPHPTILHTHGGPTAVMAEIFSPESQAWLDHGFAFLTINYRGSIAFGREFQDKILGDLGHWEVEDMVAACDWLVKAGVARADQILLTGWSYGGYLTLMGLGQRPDLWAGGMAGIAIADWAVQYEDSAETLRGYQVSIFGGTPQEQPERYAKSSPITYAENVSAPVLIIQGRNDTRTPARPIEMYEAKLKALGKPIEVHWFEAGHLGAGVEQAIEHQETMLRFAYRVLGQ